MRQHLISASIALGLAVATSADAQIANPIPEPVTNHGLAVQIRDLVRLPSSGELDSASARGPVGWARVSYVRDLPDGLPSTEIDIDTRPSTRFKHLLDSSA